MNRFHCLRYLWKFRERVSHFALQITSIAQNCNEIGIHWWPIVFSIQIVCILSWLHRICVTIRKSIAFSICLFVSICTIVKMRSACAFKIFVCMQKMLSQYFVIFKLDRSHHWTCDRTVHRFSWAHTIYWATATKIPFHPLILLVFLYEAGHFFVWSF